MKRSAILDVLRAVAVLLVFCRHSDGALLINRFGWMGVDLFFVLSGFLVSGLLFREYQRTGSVRPGRFLIRRGFKIYPQFYLLMLLTYCSSGIFHWAPKAMLAEVLFIQNYTRGVWSTTWSLAVEEHFYLLLTFALVWLVHRKRGLDSLPVWIAGMIALVFVLRLGTWWMHPDGDYLTHVFPSHLRLDSLLTGVLLSFYHHFYPERVRAFVGRFGTYLPMASILLLAPVIVPFTIFTVDHPFTYTIGFSLVALAFVLLLVSSLYPLRPRKEDGYVYRAMAGLGRMSYGFYLWHTVVLTAAVTYFPDLNQFVALVPTFLASLLLAYLSTRFVEMPFLRLRDRLTSEKVPEIAYAPVDTSASLV